MNLSTMTLPAGVDRAKLSRTRGESALRLGVRLCLVPRPHPKNRSDWQSFNGTLSRDCQSFDQRFGGVPACEEPPRWLQRTTTLGSVKSDNPCTSMIQTYPR